ncbi:helix-hairpin-helix domain-containing protein [Stenotrophomonas sp. 278]|nr:helix-hairpin-helix domain-containing protein [Stenotrophomonas sp. 278]
MEFSPDERRRLLELKGVGPTVVARLEQLGFSSLHELGAADVSLILEQASAAVGSTCWKNSPQARAAIEAAVALGRVSSHRRTYDPTSNP